MIAIINYGSGGNLQSVKKVFDYLKEKSKITFNKKEIYRAERVVLPGVGNFGEAIKNLERRNLLKTLKKSIESQKKPYLGICLGLQLLFEKSEESPNVEGLGIFEGKVKKFEKGKVPQIGWNEIIPTKEGNIFKRGYAYFVNSYYVLPEDKSIIAAKTDYFGEFTSAIQKENILAVQFHPEKSGKFGIELLQRWLEKC